jgi:hypothetical protein
MLLYFLKTKKHFTFKYIDNITTFQEESCYIINFHQSEKYRIQAYWVIFTFDWLHMKLCNQ